MTNLTINSQCGAVEKSQRAVRIAADRIGTISHRGTAVDDETGQEVIAEPELVLMELAQAEAAPPSRPWLTLLLTLVIGFAYLAGQSVAAGVLLAVAMTENPRLDVAAWAENAQSDGTVIAACLLGGAAASVPLTLVFGSTLHPGAMADYLGLRMPNAKSIVLWTLAIVAFAALTDGLMWLTGREVVPPFMRDAYWSARPPALLWLGVIVAAPVSEELVFRGFLFAGLINTRLGFLGTATLTSAIFALLHVQYGPLGIAVIFLGGLLFAAARHATQSIVPCIAMHAAMNFIATCEVALLTRPA
jgi:uncharacterized protein